MKFRLLAIAASLSIGPASAGHAVTLAQSKGFYTTAATIQFSIVGAPESDGMGGMLDIRLNGDFSVNATTGESALLRFDDVPGEARLRNAAIVDINSIAGLSLSGFSSVRNRNPDDVDVTFSFSLSGLLLDSILESDTAGMTVQNAAGVNLIAQQDLDFVAYELNYSEPSFADVAAVPLPAGLTLLLSALGCVTLLRGRQQTA